MGNCLKPQSSKKRVYDDESDDGEDWSWPTPSPAAERGTKGGYSAKNVGDFSGKITEVKIKISKKQLEQLLSKMEVKELGVDQVMTQLMSHGKRHGYEVYQHQRSWRPALQSIPEVN
ncbi:uncharacterized protein LOC114745577 [Neltuma alba]|uniref:uncharacterized protein LOC114719033 n=1 Tax=Neltuma alba TaxID=207710 RepID=UPI0010A449B3|nr:uncharacterized protein LOC114719033 [Prosopis alba]XP_028789567.1 uncharacterized protein LOC114745577 [Prosopis alba]